MRLSNKDLQALELGRKMNEVTDTHRCIFNEWPQCFNLGGGFWSTTEIADHLDKPQYAALRWRFMRTEQMEAYQQVVKSIPISTLLDTFNTLCRPIYTDFTEVTENIEFLEIAGFFYYQLFIHETIYVGYNFFNDGAYILDKDANDDDLKYKLELLKEKGGFEVFVKLNEDEFDRNNDFMHINTGITVRVPKWRNKLIRVKWGAQYQGNFRNWYNLGVMYLAYTYILESVLKLSAKRIFITTGGKSEATVERLQGQLSNLDTHLTLDLQDGGFTKEVSFIDGETLKEIRNTVYHFIDRLMAEYGRVANTNPKGERMTTMEQYKDISAIANRQKDTLENLLYFGLKAKELWGVDLEFAVSGIPEKEALYTVAHRAQTPNMEKEFFGQTEGTYPRVPYGQKTPGGKSQKTQPVAKKI